MRNDIPIIYHRNSYEMPSVLLGGVENKCRRTIDFLKDNDAALYMCFSPLALTKARLHATKVHSMEYVEFIQDTCEKGISTLGSSDIRINEYAAHHALGSIAACIAAADAAINYNNVVAIPSIGGHHAHKTHAGGYSIFNEPAILAHYLQTKEMHSGEIPKIAVLDFDIHHGDGTQSLLQTKDNVVATSIHESPRTLLYPGTGWKFDRGHPDYPNNIRNYEIGLEYSGYDLEHGVVSAISHIESVFEPDYLIIYAGFDGHRYDPLSNTQINTEIYGNISQIIQESFKCPKIHVVGGGYNFDSYSQSLLIYLQQI